MEAFVIATTSAEIPSTPRIWLVLGDKPGDNAQVEIIAERLGVPCEVKRVLPRKRYILGKPLYIRSLYHLDLERSDTLQPPWPDLILTIGRRASMAALWIQKQSRGHSRIVLLGRPKRWMERFALIIVPSQYRIPETPRVVQLKLPLMRGNEAAIQQATEEWRERFAEFPRPITALLIGGQTRPFRFDGEVARELLALATQAAEKGFLYITTSRRTPPQVISELRDGLPENARLYCWSPDNADNPYLALLGLADRFIVTGDSISMMVEVARLGKPLAIFSLPYQKNIGWYIVRSFSNWLYGDTPPNIVGTLLHRLAKALYKLGLAGYARDLTAVHRALYDQGLASPLARGFSAGNRTPEDELDHVVDQVRRLLP
jgi:mitochondrial fission protein ELM1